MASNTEPLPGTSDIWEPETLDWIELEKAARDVHAAERSGEGDEEAGSGRNGEP